MLKIIIVLVFSLVLCVQHSFGQQTSEKLQGIGEEITQLMKDYKAVGVSVAVVKDDEIIYSKGFGYRDLENKLLLTSKTVFPIGSVTKAFTGALLGVLEDEHKVDLKASPLDYIPYFEFYNDEMNNRITIEDILSHKSGIGNTGTPDVFFATENKLEAVRRLKYLKPEATIGDSFDYSNMGYTIAGTIAEKVTQTSWGDNVKKSFFTPLGMQNSYTSLSEMMENDDYSLPYGLYEGTTKRVHYEKFLSLSPAGAIKSNVRDMSKWMMTWLNKGRFGDKQIIPSDYVVSATRLQNINNDNYEEDAFLFGYGFGWRLRSSYGHFRVEHGGNTYGFSSDLAMYPHDNVGIVVLTNQDNSQLPYIIVDLIARRLFDIEPIEKYPVVVQEIYRPDTKDQPLNQDKLPSHPLKAFCGTYKAEGIGAIEFTYDGENLFAKFPKFLFKLEHLNFNAFYLEATSEFTEVFNPEFPLEFFNGLDGNISHLKLYSQKEPVVFKKINASLEHAE